MKVCEYCGGTKAIAYGPPRKLCDACHGTGVIPLLPDDLGTYLQKKRVAIERAIVDGAQWKVSGRWVPVTEADLQEFDQWLTENPIETR